MTTDLSINKIKFGVKESYFPGGSVSSGGQEKNHDSVMKQSELSFCFDMSVTIL